MATSFGALCTDFYVNQKIAVKMDLPSERETVLHLFDRVRADQPLMSKFRRYPDELSLESSRREGSYRWLALQQNTIRTGHVNPDQLEEAYALHRLLLRLAPYHLGVSPLDLDYQELMFGFDLETKANQHQIVYDALFSRTPMAALFDQSGVRPLDVQPVFGMTLNEQANLQAFFEVKATTSNGQVRSDRYRTEPLMILLTVRRLGPIQQPEDLLTHFETLREHAERLATERLVPDLLMPIRAAVGIV